MRLMEALDTSPPTREQPEEGVTIAPKIGPEDRALDGSLEAGALERRIRALTPHVGAYLILPGGERLGVRKAAVSDAAPPPPSELSVDGDRLLFGCVDAALELLEVQPAGGRAMDPAAYARRPGAQLRTAWVAASPPPPLAP